MGKKSKRKAAKAAAVAAAGATAVSDGSKLILGPRPDGIICTNENPYACAVCSCVIPMEEEQKGIRLLNVCCGTMVCTDCLSYDRCCFCKIPWYQRALASYAKKRSKEGFAWAHHFLGSLHYAGVPPYVPQSDEEAFRLFEKAANQNHPVSCIQQVNRLIVGFGCEPNLEKACVTFEKAVRACIPFQYDYKEVLSTGNNLLIVLFGNGEIEKGHSVLSNMEMFADKAGGQALGMLSVIYDRVEDFEGCRRCNKKASESVDCPITALSVALAIGNFCLSRMWYRIVSNDHLANDEGLGKMRKSLLKSTNQGLCILRQGCAWCNTNLSKSTRKLCKGCKAHCYCSRDCQAAHWEADHRSDCQKAMEVKKKTIAMMKEWAEMKKKNTEMSH